MSRLDRQFHLSLRFFAATICRVVERRERGPTMIRRLLVASVFAAGVVVAPAVHAFHMGVGPLVVAEPLAPASVGLTLPVPRNTGGCYWANCTQAHQSGEGNIAEGNAHYCSKQDRDGDGVACEW